eukprot:snap_masked-scaffold_50-processed-gene-1.27-mRNA-1 protein AED:1.00 eAED:1.00 QI:0/-1/0/0/-1/1/1/0/70
MSQVKSVKATILSGQFMDFMLREVKYIYRKKSSVQIHTSAITLDIENKRSNTSKYRSIQITDVSIQYFMV